MVLQQLIKAGLGEREAKVYLAILELGEATIAQITKKSQIKRSTVYDMLEILKEKRLINQSRHKTRPVFFAENPQKMIDSLEERKKGLQEAMPQLISLMNLLEKKPRISYFEGTESVKEIFEDTLKYPDSEILTWMPHPYLSLGEKFFWEYYNPKRLEKKIWMRVLAPDTEINKAASKEMQKFLVVTQFISNTIFSDFDIEIKIYGKTKIGIISYAEDLGIIIESQKIATGFKAIFESGWQQGN